MLGSTVASDTHLRRFRYAKHHILHHIKSFGREAFAQRSTSDRGRNPGGGRAGRRAPGVHDCGLTVRHSVTTLARSRHSRHRASRYHCSRAQTTASRAAEAHGSCRSCSSALAHAISSIGTNAALRWQFHPQYAVNEFIGGSHALFPCGISAAPAYEHLNSHDRRRQRP